MNILPELWLFSAEVIFLLESTHHNIITYYRALQLSGIDLLLPKDKLPFKVRIFFLAQQIIH